MKIISKYKDYYDYLVGVYGEDPKLVLDRRTSLGKSKYILHSKYEIFYVGFCGTKYLCLKRYDQFYYLDDIKQFDCEPHRRYRKDPNIVFLRDQLEENKFLRNRYREYPIKEPYEATNPIELISGYRENLRTPFPMLNELQFHRVIPAHDAWIQLSEFLSKKIIEPTQPVGDDKIRLQSAGFDLKTSFRGKI